MTFDELNWKINALPFAEERIEAGYLRDERLGILGVFWGYEPSEQQVALVNEQIFPSQAAVAARPAGQVFSPTCALRRDFV